VHEALWGGDPQPLLCAVIQMPVWADHEALSFPIIFQAKSGLPCSFQYIAIGNPSGKQYISVTFPSEVIVMLTHSFAHIPPSRSGVSADKETYRNSSYGIRVLSRLRREISNAGSKALYKSRRLAVIVERIFKRESVFPFSERGVCCPIINNSLPISSDRKR
jgi:hypothetical protein